MGAAACYPSRLSLAASPVEPSIPSHQEAVHIGTIRRNPFHDRIRPPLTTATRAPRMLLWEVTSLSHLGHLLHVRSLPPVWSTGRLGDCHRAVRPEPASRVQGHLSACGGRVAEGSHLPCLCLGRTRLKGPLCFDRLSRWRRIRV